MNNFIKQVIEEKFASKSQQRYFFAKANEKGSSKKEKNKWGKMAKEFSDKTDYSKIPDKIENGEEVDEIVDDKGNIGQSKKPTNINTKGITANDTSDGSARKGHGMMSTSASMGYGIGYRRFPLEEIELDGVLGGENILNNVPYDEALEDMEKEKGLPEDEAEERLEKMGYRPGDDKLNLVENPKKFMEEYLESILKQRGKDNDILSKEEEVDEVEINPIVAKQIKALKNSMKTYGLKPDHILKGLNDNE
jgi:hypothetical protein